MLHPTRRPLLKHFLLAGVAMSCGMTALDAIAAEATPSRGPELAVVNATIYTIDEQRPKAEALCVRQGRFLAVGSNDEIRKLIKADTKVIDAAGATVVPGFIDAHTHP